MAQDATGTTTSLGIPKHNTAVDPPSGKGENSMMDVVDTLLQQRVTAAGASAWQNKLLSTDTQPAFVIRGDGNLSWGPGGSTATDTILARDSVGVLKTFGSFITVGSIQSLTTVRVDPNGATNTAFASLGVNGDSQYRFLIQGGGTILWGTGSGPQDANLYRAAAGVLKTDGSFANGAYGTSLPGSPVDGQVYTLVDSTSAPTYQWTFRYNSGSGSSYKWEFIGGAPVNASVTTNETTTSTSYADLSTAGPSFTVPRAGDYMVTIRAGMFASAFVTGFSVYASVDPGNTGTPSDNEAIEYDGNVANQLLVLSSSHPITGLSASDVLKLQYRVSAGTTTGNFRNRRLSVIPIRVS